MNIGEAVTEGSQLEARALQLLRSVRGVEAVDTEVPIESGHRVDALVRFSDRRSPVVLEVKSRVNAAAAWQLIDQARHLGADVTGYIVIAGNTTAEARTLLARHGIGLIDGFGNAHVELPGLLIHLEQHGRKAARSDRPAAPRLTGKAGVIAQAVLLQPERAWKVADLADVASVSAGLAHRVLARLEAEDVLIAQGSGPQRTRRVVNPSGLLDLWAEEAAAERPQPTRGHLLARTPDARTRNLARNLDATQIPYAITGAAAAAMLAPLATAIPTTEVWVAARLLAADVLSMARAEPVEEGANVVFLQLKGDAPLAFARHAEDIAIANVFRLYADLRRDPRRGREQADNLRREVIGF